MFSSLKPVTKISTGFFRCQCYAKTFEIWQERGLYIRSPF